MSGAEIVHRVKGGLSRGRNKVGNGTWKAYKVEKTETGAGGPFGGATNTFTLVELVNAFKTSVDRNIIDGTLVLASDEQLICDGDVTIAINDKIAVGDSVAIDENTGLLTSGSLLNVVHVPDVDLAGVKILQQPVLRGNA